MVIFAVRRLLLLEFTEAQQTKCGFVPAGLFGLGRALQQLGIVVLQFLAVALQLLLSLNSFHQSSPGRFIPECVPSSDFYVDLRPLTTYVQYSKVI